MEKDSTIFLYLSMHISVLHNQNLNNGVLNYDFVNIIALFQLKTSTKLEY